MPLAAYREPGQIFSVTIVTARRVSIFADTAFGLECVGLLRGMCDAGRLRSYAHCLMPDHVHLLLGVTNGTDLVVEVGRWKSLCGLARARHGHDARMWQRSFWDHALRKDEDVLVAARYIVRNPVRAGLVDRIEDYPLSGSFEFPDLCSDRS